jgi:nitrate/TMAO reductase-like tetraheme cytochrome c subunit
MNSKQLIQVSIFTLLTLGSMIARAADPAAKWHAECSSCHVAYPPAGLPAASWQKVMAGLDKHFGADASLSAQDTQEIAKFLEQHAAKHWRGNDTPLRITDSQWFKSKHREVNAAAWKRPSIKSQSSCAACHPGADKGDFDEDNVRIPK